MRTILELKAPCGDTGTDVLPGLEAVLPVEKDRENPEIPGFCWLFFEGNVICGASIEW